MAYSGILATGGRMPTGGGAGYYGGSQRISAEDPENQAGNSAIGGSRTYDPKTGMTSYETQYGETTEQNLAAREKANIAAEQRRMASLQALMSQYGGGAGAPGAPQGQIAFDEQGARDAAFARAKDKAGATARASMDSLREYLGSSGQLGGAKEMQGMGEVMAGAAGSIGDFNRDQLTMDLDRAGQISDRERAAGLEQQKMAQDRWRTLFSQFSEGKGPIY